MYSLIEYSDTYSKSAGSLYQFCRDEPKNPILDSESFNFKSRFFNNTINAGTINAEIAVPLKYLNTHWRLIFGNVIRCSALWFWVGYFIYFKFIPVFLMEVLKVKLWWVRARERKRECIFCNVYFVQRNVFNIWVLSQFIAYQINFQNIFTFAYQKTLLLTLVACF